MAGSWEGWQDGASGRTLTARLGGAGDAICIGTVGVAL